MEKKQIERKDKYAVFSSTHRTLYHSVQRSMIYRSAVHRELGWRHVPNFDFSIPNFTKFNLTKIIKYSSDENRN